MYIRESKTKNKKTGKVYIKHTLVESVCTERGPRQRMILTLGRLTIEKAYWKDLALALEACLTGTEEVEYLAFYTLPEAVISEISYLKEVAMNYKRKQASKNDSPSKEKVYQEIDVDSVKTCETSTLGPELVANQAWELLGFDKILAECSFSPKERARAAAVIWGRLIQPGSDLLTWRWLREQSCMSEFFEVDISRVHKDRIYEISDKLLANKDFLEKTLYERQNEIFPGRNTLFLFDLTNFYFEGRCEGNELAARGKSKEKRKENPLVSLALMVDQDGFPVKSKVYEGNVGEPKTLKEVLRESGLLDDESLYKPTLAMDRGIATKENIALLREYNFPFVVIERADRRSDFKQEFIDLEGFETITDSKGQPIQIKKIGKKVLCRSEARRTKENAMSERWIKNAVSDLNQLKKSVDKGTFKKAEVIKARLAIICKRYCRFDDIFTLTHEADNPISYTMTDIVEKEDSLHGCYVIECDKVEGDAQLIWRTYTTLTKVESAFRSMKTDLGTRPVYHQGAKRTEAHLFLSILAYHMLINIEHRLKAKGNNSSWKTIRQALSNHCRTTVQWTNKEEEIWQKRTSDTPGTVARQIYCKLQIKNPLPDHVYKHKESTEIVPKNKTAID
jgi:transposase